MKLFGFEISRKITSDEKPSEPLPSPIPKVDSDGATVVSTSGYYGTYLDLDGSSALNDNEQIQKYRQTADQPECNIAINHIVNEAIFMGDKGSPVSLDLTDVEFGDDVKNKIQCEFKKVISLLNFAEDGADIFRHWYVDGRLFYYIVADPEKAEEGIKELRYIDPLRIRKVREIERLTTPDGIPYERNVGEYFVYSENTLGATAASIVSTGTSIDGIKMDPNSIIYVPSGVLDTNRKQVISHLHKSLKVVNEVNMMETALVIYRLARAPERRIFYIDVGSLPKGKAEEYVQSIMSKYRNKLVYNAQTGEIVDDRKHMSILEDFWLPRREGGRGTEIDTLPGGENLGEIDDIIYFQRKLYKSLNVPITRLDPEAGFAIGRATEISREEVTFQKFIDSLRRKFSYLILDSLRIQLLLRKVITEDDWSKIREQCSVDFQKDNYFAELKNFEIIRERMDILSTIESSVGTYFSKAWVRSNILSQTDDDIKKIDEEIAAEAGAVAAEAEPEVDDTGDETDAPAAAEPTDDTSEPEQDSEPVPSGRSKDSKPQIPPDFRLAPGAKPQSDPSPDTEVEIPVV